MQLVRDDDERVVLWDSMRDRIYGPVEVAREVRRAAEQVRDFSPSRATPATTSRAFPPSGPKTASDLLRSTGRSTASTLNSTRSSKPKLRENLVKHEADARISQTLVTLRPTSRSTSTWTERYGGADHGRASPALHGARVQRACSTRSTPLEQRMRDGQRRPRKGEGRNAAAVSAASARVGAGAGHHPVYRHVVDEPELNRRRPDARRRRARSASAVSDDHARSDARADPRTRARDRRPGKGIYVPHRASLPRRAEAAHVRARCATRSRRCSRTRRSEGRPRFEADGRSPSGAQWRSASTGPIFDPMLAAYLLDPEAPHALKELARREFGVAARPSSTRRRNGRRADRVMFDRARRRARDDLRRADAESRSRSPSARSARRAGRARPI